MNDLQSGLFLSMPVEEALGRIWEEMSVQWLIGPGPTFRLVSDGMHRPVYRATWAEVNRIVREALTNAIIHAQAANVAICVTYEADTLHIVVRDDGRGIDPEILAVGRAGHWGLCGMRERAARIGAQFRIRSAPSRGTEVDLCVPGHTAYGYAPVVNGRGRRWRVLDRLWRVGDPSLQEC
ncbi:MAG TPA: ATP-binding protein [Bryobacteraceae bacterium]|nr:ATP-binding protein [Bryobacteraceae bacterium]